MFYYEKGIPDDRSHETSQQNGTTYWFPDFQQDDWHVKGWFNYFLMASTINSFRLLIL